MDGGWGVGSETFMSADDVSVMQPSLILSLMAETDQFSVVV